MAAEALDATDEITIQGEENLTRAEAHAAAHRVPNAVTGAKGHRVRAGSVEEASVVAVIPVRVDIPTGLAAAEREGIGTEADSDAVRGGVVIEEPFGWVCGAWRLLGCPDRDLRVALGRGVPRGECESCARVGRERGARC